MDLMRTILKRLINDYVTYKLKFKMEVKILEWLGSNLKIIMDVNFNFNWFSNVFDDEFLSFWSLL